MKYIYILAFFTLTLLSACQNHKQHTIVNLPQGVTNNAVALIKNNKGIELYSFNGLSSGKTYKDINKLGFRYQNNKWSQIQMPDSSQPVLASTAVSIDSTIYLMGGYTVNQKGEEKSMPEIFALDTIKQKWSVVTHMPVPVDDTVALVYDNRYIYLISGWHGDDNVSHVQVYDTKENNWFEATQYPVPAVFGHAGGIVGNQMIVCDGVKVVPTKKSRDFVSSPVCVKGVINPSQPNLIDWEIIPHHSKTAYYRMAAVGDVKSNKIIFAGGSNNPYNYDGIGYNGAASVASNLVHVYDIPSNKWQTKVDVMPATMDHRALLTDDKWFYIIGGMQNKQMVSSKVIKFKLDN